MKASPRLPALLFLLCLIMGAISLLQRVVAVSPLYLDSTVRQGALTALRKATEERGWILSDVEIVSAERGFLRLIHSEHLRGPADARCYTLAYSSVELLSCDR